MFPPGALEHARRKVTICAAHGIESRPPVSEDLAHLAAMLDADAWQAIYAKDVAMMEGVRLRHRQPHPVPGRSADVGTLVEPGWFLGRGRPVFGYSNSALPFAERSRRQVAAIPDAVLGLAVEGFGLADNLMIPGAVLQGGGHAIVLPQDGQERAFDALDAFERCVAFATRILGCCRWP